MPKSFARVRFAVAVSSVGRGKGFSRSSRSEAMWLASDPFSGYPFWDLSRDASEDEWEGES
jgi:hypothetical protein